MGTFQELKVLCELIFKTIIQVINTRSPLCRNDSKDNIDERLFVCQDPKKSRWDAEATDNAADIDERTDGREG